MGARAWLTDYLEGLAVRLGPPREGPAARADMLQLADLNDVAAERFEAAGFYGTAADLEQAAQSLREWAETDRRREERVHPEPIRIPSTYDGPDPF